MEGGGTLCRAGSCLGPKVGVMEGGGTVCRAGLCLEEGVRWKG